MIIVFHDRKKVTKVFDFTKNQELSFHGETIQKTLFQLGETYPDVFIGWCHYKLENHISHNTLNSIFHHDLIMASFSTSKAYVIPNTVGYVEDSTYLKVKHNVTYPTWFMSSDIGGIYAEVLVQFKKLKEYKLSFDMFLNYVSQDLIKLGLFCYSEPKLLEKGYTIIDSPKHLDLFFFVKNHYRMRWLFILFFSYLVYEKQFKLWRLLKGLLAPKLAKDILDVTHDNIMSDSSSHVERSYDVIIPTLGRATFLKDVLLDLAEQTVLPNKIIIVEQNALKDSKTELNYLYDQKWPFEIDHTFTHQLGACNARNIALTKLTASWVFLADDDIRIEKNLLHEAFDFIDKFRLSAINMSSLQKNERLKWKHPIQLCSFSTNSSIVNTHVLKDLSFGMEHEFGYGEDSDFGMKIRNKGADIIFFPTQSILHLKAPVGGFRAKIELPWDKEAIQPKPSPMVLAYRLKHTTKEQLLGYKTILFFNFFKEQKFKNYFSYLSRMRKRWKRSMYWTKHLIEKHSPNDL